MPWEWMPDAPYWVQGVTALLAVSGAIIFIVVAGALYLSAVTGLLAIWNREEEDPRRVLGELRNVCLHCPCKESVPCPWCLVTGESLHHYGTPPRLLKQQDD